MSTADDLKALKERVDALEARLDEGGPGGPVQDPSGTLFIFNRPGPGVPRFGLGSRMGSPDVLEAVRRANSCVGYQGNLVHGPAAEDEVWGEIERLKVLDADLLPKYRMLDPAFAGFALLTGLIKVAKYDAITFGTNARNREAFAGTTIQSWLNDEFAVQGTPGIAGE